VRAIETGAIGARRYAVLRKLGSFKEDSMPKMKTHKTAAKRFKVTGSGKIRRIKIGKSHLRRKKASRVLRSFDKTMEVADSGTVKRVKRLLPYVGKKGKR
jgi:large subunit ribosomal protein L35